MNIEMRIEALTITYWSISRILKATGAEWNLDYVPTAKKSVYKVSDKNIEQKCKFKRNNSYLS